MRRFSASITTSGGKHRPDPAGDLVVRRFLAAAASTHVARFVDRDPIEPTEGSVLQVIVDSLDHAKKHGLRDVACVVAPRMTVNAALQTAR